MRIGLMIGSDRERARGDRLAGLVDDVRDAERAGFTSIWIPQVPGYVDALTAIAVIGGATERIELGTSVVPVQTRHPVAMAQEALTTQSACGGRFTLGLGPSHHWLVEDQLGLTYERPAALMRDYLDVLDAAFTGPGPVDVENDAFRVHSPMDVLDAVPMPIVISALAPVMLRLAGERTSGTVLWMADERAIAEHVVPRITKAASGAGRPAPRIIAGVPVTLCAASEVDAVKTRARDVLGHADFSPNYERLLEHGDAHEIDDIMAVGDESAIVTRLQRFRDAGVTDLAARAVPYGDDAGTRLESKRRTLEAVATMCPEA
ncbi:MAG TPA: TIGR03564 family F420-dependent LLM class oxidoreductase [Acidimicrobiia bacterium]|jgi:F420-dependent oxidoreductase-like protein